MLRRWMPSEDVAVRLADALDAEAGCSSSPGASAAPRRVARLEAAGLLVESDVAGVQ